MRADKRAVASSNNFGFPSDLTASCAPSSKGRVAIASCAGSATAKIDPSAWPCANARVSQSRTLARNWLTWVRTSAGREYDTQAQTCPIAGGRAVKRDHLSKLCAAGGAVCIHFRTRRFQGLGVALHESHRQGGLGREMIVDAGLANADICGKIGVAKPVKPQRPRRSLSGVEQGRFCVTVWHHRHLQHMHGFGGRAGPL